MELSDILLKVQKPARYIGGEQGAVIKDKSKVDVRFAFCFADSYEVGMSHLGMKILYSVANSLDWAWCERVFAPWEDMETEMRKNNIPLYALESGDKLSDFDIIGFTVPYEMCYTNILNCLDLGGVPVHAKERNGLKNLVIAGGPCTCNPEPLVDFVDLFLL
ncbi:MAG: B12-binding domain-containing radical SAM protein, partial [Clostridia bacterium]|nr:B12-binding domain-containing radical SAM protein [Clostridia bacterium]